MRRCDPKRLVVFAISHLVLGLGLAVAASPREDVSLNDGWRFVRREVTGCEHADFDDSSFSTVNLPHTWNNLDGQDGGNDYYRGIGWYRRHLAMDSRYAGKSLFLKFDAASVVAEVYVNGTLVGSHRGAFAAFCFEITSLVKVGGDNVIAVKANNDRNPEVAPLSGDFTVCGGLYRDAHLLVMDKLSVSPVDEASPGVYIRQRDVTAGRAELEITTKLRNAHEIAKTATVRCTVADATGKTVATVSNDRALAARGTGDVVQPITIPSPHLWNGRSDPYLYQVTVEVLDGERVTDRVSQPLGVRFFRVDPDRGFFLNGQRYALQGVNRHQDRLDQGWAIGPAEHEEDFNLIREMGCTGIRLAHYQHAQYFYDLCDRGGMIILAELCLIDESGPSQRFADNLRQQLTEMIKQNYNHPAILFWSLANELRFRDKNREQAECALLADLHKLAKTLDPGRLTAAASLQFAPHPSHQITDLLGFNRFYGWYNGTPGDWTGKTDEMHRELPGRPTAYFEYGAGGSILHHEIDPTQPLPTGLWHPEEWQCAVHEQAWKAMKDRPWLWGTFLWNMFDFAADHRDEGDQPGRNDKGMITYDRKVKKDVFYWYKANWTDEPVVHITSRRFTPRIQKKTPVKIYSNCDEVELKVNGVSQGSLRFPDRIFLWPDVTFAPGTNQIEAVAVKSGQSQTDSCAWVCQ